MERRPSATAGYVTYRIAVPKDVSELHWEVPERYEIEGLIGRGAYGYVFSAADRQSGRKVALKRSNDMVFGRGTLAKRLLREIRLLRGLRHPHIIPILDVMQSVDEARPAFLRCRPRDPF